MQSNTRGNNLFPLTQVYPHPPPPTRSIGVLVPCNPIVCAVLPWVGFTQGLVAPHVDLLRAGFSVGWRMYWPREEQAMALAPACVLTSSKAGASPGVSVREVGVLWAKGPAGSAGPTASAPFGYIGAKTLSGRWVPSEHMRCGTLDYPRISYNPSPWAPCVLVARRVSVSISMESNAMLTLTSAVAVREGKWTDVVFLFGESACLLVDGHVAASAPVPQSLLAATLKRDRVVSEVFESPHPYPPHSATHRVSLPADVTEMTITFDPSSDLGPEVPPPHLPSHLARDLDAPHTHTPLFLGHHALQPTVKPATHF